MVQIAASIFHLAEAELAGRVKQVSNADYIHIDVTDCKFVKDIHGGASLFWDEKKLEVIAANTTVPLDIHLMIANPAEHVERYASFSPKYISFHLEATNDTSDSRRIIDRIREYGVSPVIAINPDTPVTDISHLLDQVGMVLLMSVVPGKGGQGYIPNVTKKIEYLKRMINEMDSAVLIEVDGGIKLNNAYLPVNAGANVLVSGTGVFNHPQYHPHKVIELMKSVSFEADI